MALIQCPECGKDISSNAGQCVHCGCKFSVCPECGKILVGQPDFCTNCGSPTKSTLQQVSDTQTEEGIINGFHLHIAKDRKLRKISGYIGIFMVLAIVAMVIAAGALFGAWFSKVKGASDLGKLDLILELKGDFGGIQTCLVFLCIIIILFLLLAEGESLFWELRYKSRMKQERPEISLFVLTMKGLAYNQEAYEIEYENSIGAAYLVSKPEAQTPLLITTGVQFLLSLLTAIFLTVFVAQNVQEFMNAKVTDSRCSFQYMWLIIGGLFLIATVVYSKIVAKKRKAQMEQWKEEILSEK